MRTRLAAGCACIAAIFFVTTPSAQGPSGPGDPIRLKVGTFRPARGEPSPVPAALRIAGYEQGQRGYYVVQFRGPVTEAAKNQVIAAGAELLGYIPDFAFKARMSPGQARRVRRLASVAWVGIYEPGFKLAPELVRNGTHAYLVRIERGADRAQARAAIAATGATILKHQVDIVMVAADRRQLEAIAHVLDVASVQNFVVRRKLNEYGGGVVMGANAAHLAGYDGSGQTIGIADTGIGNGVASSAHPNIPAARVSAIFNWPGVADACFSTILNDGAIDVDSGHGTHVAGSALSGGGPGGEGKGVAPGASLVFQAVENWVTPSVLCQILGIPAGYYLVGIPFDIRDLFQQAYNSGARVHSNSWGSEAAGAYTIDSENADEFIWSHRDMTITFAAGNSGVDSDADGVIDEDSILSPASAKNVITVGASENDRQGSYPCDPALTYTNCAAQGGQNSVFTYGAAWPASFPAPPIATDPSAGNPHQMAAFSSRGPTDDLRVKPDVVAPGTWVLSAYSDRYQQGYDASANPRDGAWQYGGWGIPQGQAYKYMGGTSMATPLAAGASAVVRAFYQAAPRNHAASAALVKATLINSAVDLLDENNDGVNDNAFPIPNVHEGWGRIDLANATDGTQQFVDHTGGIATGGTATYQYTVAGGQPLKATLVWSDYPSTETAFVNLVNDLDLVVIAPGGATYYGNRFSGGWSMTGGSADRANNVENVYIQSPGAGTWTVQVRGFNVPVAPQPFALVVDGASTDAPPSVVIVSPAEGASVAGNQAIQIDAVDTEDAPGSLNVQWNIDGGAWQNATHNPLTHRYEATWNSTTVSDGGHTVNARATDSRAQTGADANGVTVDNIPDPPPNTAPTVAIVTPAEGSTVANVVGLQIAASDAQDAAGSLNVEWNVDGGLWQPALYNAATGYYEAAWNSATIADGGHSVNARARDSGLLTGADTNLVTVDNVVEPPNTAPSVAVINPAPATTVAGVVPIRIAASDAQNASGTLAVQWNIDGGAWQAAAYNSVTGYYEASWNSVSVADGSHTVNARATDSGNLTGSGSCSVTIDNITSVHVGDLDGTSAGSGSRWQATVTITAHDNLHNLLQGTTVTGTWSLGSAASGSCTADAAGRCSVTSGQLKKTDASVTFTITNVTRPSLSYQSSANHDPDGDSNGTRITVRR
jgi:serine protease AprX